MGFLVIFFLFLVQPALALNLSADSISGPCTVLQRELPNARHCVQDRNENGFCTAELSCLSPNLSLLSNKTFKQPGPNCFATALKASNVYDGFRAVSEREFNEVLNTSCVEVASPQYGDIGVYFVENFGPIHAFVYVSKSLSFEKPGVDYIGQTPVRFNLFDNIDYVHKASSECRQYGDESCHNSLKYLRCSKPSLPQSFQNQLNLVNKLIDQSLHLAFLSENDFLEIEASFKKLLKKSTNTKLETEIIKSISVQMEFFRTNYLSSPSLSL